MEGKDTHVTISHAEKKRRLDTVMGESSSGVGATEQNVLNAKEGHFLSVGPDPQARLER